MRSPVLHPVRWFTLALTLVLLLCATVGAAAASALVMRMSADELTDASATVVVAKATDTDSRWTRPQGADWTSKGTIVTDVRLAVFEVLKGDARRSMAITVPGGTVGRVGVPVEDAPRFVAGQTYVIFLAANGQVVAWRNGQPQVVGARVPALHTSLTRLKADVARQVGHRADVLRPWSGRAPAPPVAPEEFVAPRGAGAAPLGGAVPVSSPSSSAPSASGGMGVGGGVVPSVSGGVSVTPAGADPPRGTTPALPASVEPRAVSTLFADDFENGSLSQWSILVPNPLFTNASQWGPDWWLSDADQMYHWAYSSQKYAWYATMWMWSSQNLYGGHYANNDNTWMIAGPFNLSSYSHAVLSFDEYVQTAGLGDYVGAWFSTDGNMFGGPYWYGQEGSWGDPPYFVSRSIDMTAVPTGSGSTNYCGQPQVWVAFCFRSDGSGTSVGAAVDNVELRAGTSPIPVISDISPGSAPSGTYLVPARNQSRVTITGSGFGAAQGRVAFYYQDGEPLITGIVRSWSSTSIVCDVPIGTINNYPGSAGSGPVYVITAGNVWSGGFAFDVPFAYGNGSFEASRCPYRVNMDGVQQAAVDAAAQSWNNVGTQMQFQNVGPCTTTPVGSGSSTHMPRDGRNDLCFDSLPWPGVIAAAFPLTVNGRVLETDICFNTTGGFSWGNAATNSSLMDTQTIAAHEIGHWLNLRDLYGPGDTGRVMFGFCGTGVVKRALTAGEVAGIQWIYADHGLDTVGPVAQAKSLTVTRGKTAKVRFAVNDPAPSCGVATASIVIKNRSGKVVKAKRNVTAYTRFWYTWPFTCKLARGRYSIVVTATDQLGFGQTKSVKGYLTVK